MESFNLEPLNNGIDVHFFEKHHKDSRNLQSAVYFTNRIVLTPLDKEMANTISRAQTILHEMQCVSHLNVYHDPSSKGMCTICTDTRQQPQLARSLNLDTVNTSSTIDQIARMEVLPKVLF